MCSSILLSELLVSCNCCATHFSGVHFKEWLSRHFRNMVLKLVTGRYRNSTNNSGETPLRRDYLWLRNRSTLTLPHSKNHKKVICKTETGTIEERRSRTREVESDAATCIGWSLAPGKNGIEIIGDIEEVRDSLSSSCPLEDEVIVRRPDKQQQQRVLVHLWSVIKCTANGRTDGTTTLANYCLRTELEFNFGLLVSFQSRRPVHKTIEWIDYSPCRNTFQAHTLIQQQVEVKPVEHFPPTL